MNAAATSPLTSMFNRVDTDKNQGINAAEMKAMLQRARVSPMAVGSATDAMMEALDANRNGQVDAKELKDNLGNVIFVFVRNAAGKTPTAAEMPKATDDWFTSMDSNKDNKVNQPELKAELLAEIQAKGDSFPDMRADAGARLGVQLIDNDADAAVARAELAALVAEMYGSGNA